MSSIHRKRTVRKTTLMYGEGSDDQCWLNYLKSLFAKEKTVKIKNGGGGSPDSVIKRMVGDISFNDYDGKIALLDTDRPEFIEAKNLANEHSITLIPSNGCIELELLELLRIIYPKKVSGAALKRARVNSHQAKAEFKKVCEHSPNAYAKFFTNETLIEARSSSTWLDMLLAALEAA